MKKLSYEPVPHYVQIEATYACNVNFQFFYNPQEKTKFNPEKLKKIVKNVASAKIPIVQLTGGEPSLLPVNFLNEMIEELSQDSNVTLQTNGMVYLKDLSNKLSLIYVSIHGKKDTHNSLEKRGSWAKTISTIKRYLSDGFEVNCDFTLTSENYDEFKEIALYLADLGVSQYTVNKFEPAGIGIKSFEKLRPRKAHFKHLVTQMIEIKQQTDMRVGFCTAIPYCLDKRLVENGLTANCGAGVSFLSINPNGEVRICNQSSKSYGNVLKEDLLKIWNKDKINEFRNLKWVDEPCKSCFLFQDCLGGCKVDGTVVGEYCIDYSVRNYDKVPIDKNDWEKRRKKYIQSIENKQKFDNSAVFKVDKFTRLNLSHSTPFLVTRYQVVKLDKTDVQVFKKIIEKERFKFDTLINLAQENSYSEKSLRNLLVKLLNIRAVNLI